MTVEITNYDILIQQRKCLESADQVFFYIDKET